MIRTARLKIFKSTFAVLLFLSPLYSIGQKNHLDKKVSLEFEKQKLEIVLAEIEKQGNFGLSYNAELVNQDSLVSIQVRDEKVSMVLNSIFSSQNFGYKSIGRHLVLYSKISKENPPLKIQGFVVDARSGEMIRNATIYEPENSITASSNKEGFYEITVKSSDESIGLSYSKYGYRDSVVFVTEEKITRSTIYLIPLPQKESKINAKELNPEIPDVHEQKLVKWIVPQEQINSSKNLQLFENNLAQVSFLPLVGTNGLLSGNVTNNLSLNIFSGYSQGLNGLEIGGFVNIIRENVIGTQIAGFGNITGNATEGAQVAGFFNYNGGDLKGGQVAGFSNILFGDVNGIQAAGFSNSLRGKMNGIQVAGFSNLTTSDVDGIQAAGFSNVALGDVKLAQISGFSNFSKNVEGIQAAGFMNVANGNVKTIQAAGFTNFARGNAAIQASGFANLTFKSSTFQGAGFANLTLKNTNFQVSGFSNLSLGRVDGIQASGFFNYARELNGFQLGFINASEIVEAGIPIGFLSFVKTGVHSLEYSFEEFFPFNLTFRTGVPLFYNILKFGIGPNSYHFTYGLGSSILNKNNWDLNLELLNSVIYPTTTTTPPGNIVKFQPIVSYSLYKSLKVNFGPTFNLAIINSNPIDGYAPFYRKPLFEGNFRGDFNSYQAWIGFHIGLQIL